MVIAMNLLRKLVSRRTDQGFVAIYHTFQQPAVKQRGIIPLTVTLGHATIFRPVHVLIGAGQMEIGFAQFVRTVGVGEDFPVDIIR